MFFFAHPGWAWVPTYDIGAETKRRHFVKWQNAIHTFENVAAVGLHRTIDVASWTTERSTFAEFAIRLSEPGEAVRYR